MFRIALQPSGSIVTHVSTPDIVQLLRHAAGGRDQHRLQARHAVAGWAVIGILMRELRSQHVAA